MFAHPLVRKISIAVTIKLIAIVILFLAFFAPADRPTMDADAAARAILGLPVEEPVP